MAGLYFDKLEEIVNIQNHRMRESAKQSSANKAGKKGKSKGVYIVR